MAGFNMRSWSQRSWLPEARGAQGTVVTQSPPWLCPRGAGLLAEPLCSLGQASTPLSSAVTPGFAQRLEVSDGEHPAQCQDIVGAVQRAASVHKGPEHPPGKGGSCATLEAPWLEVTRSRRGGGGLNLIPCERPSGELMWTRSWGETPVKNQVGGQTPCRVPAPGESRRGRRPGRRGLRLLCGCRKGPLHPCRAPSLPRGQAAAMGSEALAPRPRASGGQQLGHRPPASQRDVLVKPHLSHTVPARCGVIDACIEGPCVPKAGRLVPPSLCFGP